MKPRQIPLAAMGCLLLAGALIYGLALTKREAAPAVQTAASSQRTAATPAHSTSGATLDAPSDVTAETSAQPSQENVVTPPRTPVARTARAAASPPPGPSSKKPDRVSRKSAPEESQEQAAETIPAQQPPVGLRLAPDVRLPVAAMPHDLKISPIAQQALDQIVVDYYQDLAAGLKHRSSGETAAAEEPPLEKSASGELTQIITPGPATDAARERADYRFRALFGSAAYNRMTMRAVMESKMPVTASE